MARKVLIYILSIIITISCTACSPTDTQELLDNNAEKYGFGKTEESYELNVNQDLLDELISKYSGSFYEPSGNTMTDDEHNDLKNNNENSDEIENTTEISIVTSSDSIPKVSNYDDLKSTFDQAYENMSETIEFQTANGFSVDPDKDWQKIYTQLLREDPINVSGVESWSTWNNGDEYYISVGYEFDTDLLREMRHESLKLVDKAYNEIKTNGLSEYDTVCAVNNYLCDNVYYPSKEPYEPVTHTAYGALKNGCAVCDGYSCAAKLLLEKFNIECDIEVGTCLDGGGHAWNLVKVDGNWYQMDVTWNDGSTTREEYLLVTDEYMKQSRSWDESDFPKTADEPYIK